MEKEILDPNLLDLKVSEADVVWHDALDAPFSLHGVYYDEGMAAYRRMPLEVAERVNNGVRYYSSCTSGGRLRFRTDSPYVALCVHIPPVGIESNMPLSSLCGFSLYVNGAFSGKLSATANEAFESRKGSVIYSGSIPVRPAREGVFECELYFPTYGGVKDLQIGLAEGCTLLPPTPYKNQKPLVFYGSSIFQGAAASRPGNDFAAIIARRMGADYLNFGCSGSGNAEDVMMDYLTAIDARAYIFDYNLWPSRPDRVLPPHYDVYRRFRDAHPNIPIVMIDKPGYTFSGEGYTIRSKMIRDTYERATREGDRLVGFLDAKDMLGDIELDALADTAHPNDYGFFRMADTVGAVLSELIARAE